MQHASQLKSTLPARRRQRYVPPQIWEMSPLQTEFILQKVAASDPAAAQRMGRALEDREPEPPAAPQNRVALRASALLTTAGLILAPVLVLADFIGAVHLYHASPEKAPATVVVWIVCCLALALGPGWLLDFLPGFLDSRYKARWLMLLIAGNLIAGFAVLYRWSTLPPWLR